MAAAAAAAEREVDRLKAALTLAEQRLADVQEVAGLCNWYADADGGVVQFSPEAWTVLGLDPARGPIDTDTIRRHLNPDDLPLLLADRARVLAGEARVTSRFRFRGDDGVERWLESRATRVQALPGQPGGSVGTVCDISESMRTRHDLERHRSQLEELVVSRTVQLAQASERAEAAARVKSAFLSHTSHEIRTPLNVIVSLSHLMQRGASDPAQLARVQAVEQAARHLSAIVDDLLDLARAEGSHLSLRSRPLRPATVLDEVATMLRPQAGERGLRIDVEPSGLDHGVRLRGDAARLRQALLNAGRWAVGACANGVLRLRVRASAADDARVALRLEVDLPDAVPVFDPDADADLASLRRLANLMAGECGLQRLPDGGSRCWFTALLDTDVDVESRPVPAVDDVASQLRQRHAGRRVLVAEDDEVNQLVMRELLNEVDLRVDTAVDGQDAIERVTSQPYALVVLDLRMPRLDGLGAARAMRALPALDGTPIVAITANAFEEDRAACRAAGMNDFLPKPIDVERLYEMLLHWLDRSPVGVVATALPPLPASASAPQAATSAPPPPLPAGLDARLVPLFGLEGVDALGGLASVGGKVEVYRRLLGVFVKTHEGDGTAMRERVLAGDAEAASRLAHRLRGSAATLGLIDVETAAAALESAIDSADLEVSLPLLVDAVHASLGSTLRQLGAVLSA